MTHRERFRQVMSFGSFDRPPRWEYGAWPQTLHRWRQEGLAEGSSWPNQQPHYAIEPRASLAFRIDMIPPFEEQTLEEDERARAAWLPPLPSDIGCCAPPLAAASRSGAICGWPREGSDVQQTSEPASAPVPR